MKEDTSTESAWIVSYHRYTGRLASEAMREKALQGDLPGCAPVGYVNVRDRGRSRVIPDLIMGPLMREAFELASAGVSLRGILAVLAPRGLVSRNGRQMGASSLKLVLTNPFYTGKMSIRGALVPGNHESLVSDELFGTVQQGLATRRRNVGAAQRK